MLDRLLHNALAASSRPAAATPAGRVEVCPPEPQRGPWWTELGRWLAGTWELTRPAAGGEDAEPPVRGMTALEPARAEFIATLWDIDSKACRELQSRIHRAHSLRELWHLRTEMFSLIAHRHDQAEAEQRLAWLNRYFPTRSPRSGFGAL
jgi:hypothetical protein